METRKPFCATAEEILEEDSSFEKKMAKILGFLNGREHFSCLLEITSKAKDVVAITKAFQKVDWFLEDFSLKDVSRSFAIKNGKPIGKDGRHIFTISKKFEAKRHENGIGWIAGIPKENKGGDSPVRENKKVRNARRRFQDIRQGLPSYHNPDDRC